MMFSACCNHQPITPQKNVLSYSIERAEFELVFKCKSSRSALIRTIAADDSKQETTLQLRYCACADDFADTLNKREKRQKARKIVCMFMQNGSMFQLHTIPDEHLKGLLQSKCDSHVIKLRDYFADLLSQDEFIDEAIRATNL